MTSINAEDTYDVRVGYKERTIYLQCSGCMRRATKTGFA